MKVRIGFVSNSSSTSFIIIGQSLGPCISDSCAEKLISKGRLYALCGDDWDACDFFPISNGMWKSYKKYHSINTIEFYDVQKTIEDGKVKKSEIEGNEFNLFTIEVSHHSCSTIQEFESNHLSVPSPKPLIPKEAQLKLKDLKEIKYDIEKSGCEIVIVDGEFEIEVKDED